MERRNNSNLIRLDANKSNRETTIAKIGAFGADTGADTKSMMAFKAERLRTGLYKGENMLDSSTVLL